MIGRTIGSFRIEAELARGSLCRVYRGIQQPTGREVAIKVIPDSGDPRTRPLDERRAWALLREADVLRSLQHPGIVPFLACGRTDGVTYLAMGLAPGILLAERRPAGVPVPWRDAATLALSVCQPLAHTHKRYFVHMNLNPQVIFADETGKTTLTGLGNARRIAAGGEIPPSAGLVETAHFGTSSGAVIGTPAYMAPEQIMGLPELTGTADLYALGCILHLWLTGGPPFRGSNPMELLRQHLRDVPAPVSAKVQGIPQPLVTLVGRLLVKEPPKRPSGASEVADILRAILEGNAWRQPAPGEARPAGWIRRLWTRRRG